MFDNEDNDDIVIEVHEVDFEREIADQETLMEKTLELGNIEEVLTGEQGVNQELAIDLQNIASGMCELRRNIRSYTQSMSRTNYEITLEDVGTIHRGVRLGILAVMITIIAKVINFIYRAWKGDRDSKNTSERLGSIAGKLEAARNKLSNIHIDKVHHLFAVHGDLVAFVNDKMGSKLPKVFTASNVKEVFHEKWKGIYSDKLSGHMTTFTRGLVNKENVYEKLIETLLAEITHYFQVIETAFETVKAADNSNDTNFKAESLGFKFDHVTNMLSLLKVSFDASKESPAVTLQRAVNDYTQIKPELAMPDIANLQSFDSLKVGKELTAFKHDEFVAKNNSFQQKVTEYKGVAEGRETRNDEVTKSLGIINKQIISMACLAHALHKLNECYKEFMSKKNIASKETIKFDIHVFETIAKAKDILTASEIKLIKDQIKSSNDILSSCYDK